MPLLTNIIHSVFGVSEFLTKQIDIFLGWPYKYYTCQVFQSVVMHSGVYPFEQVHLLHQDLRLTVEQADYTRLKLKKKNNNKRITMYLETVDRP